jgi:murein DD-endopeptidase MepM/ murein hydrolase activator NlpD
VTRYGHLSKFAVWQGRDVKRGDIIGYVGSTGRATGPHLHYEVLANGKLMNPLQLLVGKSSQD